MTLPKWPLPRTATKWKLSSPIPASDRIGRDGRWGWLGESRGLAGWLFFRVRIRCWAGEAFQQ